MNSYDSEFSRILNYFQLTHWSFRKNQFLLVEKVYIGLQENRREYMKDYIYKATGDAKGLVKFM